MIVGFRAMMSFIIGDNGICSYLVALFPFYHITLESFLGKIDYSEFFPPISILSYFLKISEQFRILQFAKSRNCIVQNNNINPNEWFVSGNLEFENFRYFGNNLFRISETIGAVIIYQSYTRFPACHGRQKGSQKRRQTILYTEYDRRKIRERIWSLFRQKGTCHFMTESWKALAGRRKKKKKIPWV